MKNRGKTVVNFTNRLIISALAIVGLGYLAQSHLMAVSSGSLYYSEIWGSSLLSTAVMLWVLRPVISRVSQRIEKMFNQRTE